MYFMCLVCKGLKSGVGEKYARLVQDWYSKWMEWTGSYVALFYCS